MKKICITLLAGLLIGLAGKSQTVNREIGLRMGSLNSFGIIWKKQKTENRFCRFTATAANFNFETGDATTFQLATVAMLGIEKRARLTDKVYFIFGPQGLSQLSAGYATNTGFEDLYNVDLGLGIGFLAGFHLDFSKHLYMDLDVTPSILPYMRFDQNDNFRVGVRGGISNGGAGINLVYKLGPTPKKMKKGNAAE